MSDDPAAGVTAVTATGYSAGNGHAPDSGDADAQRLHSIGDVARLLAMPHHVLRYWEQRLPQLHPVKRAGGRRYYRDADVALIRLTRELVEHRGYRLDAAARVAAQQLAGHAMPHEGGSRGTGSSLVDANPLSPDAYRRLRRLRDQLAAAIAV